MTRCPSDLASASAEELLAALVARLQAPQVAPPQGDKLLRAQDVAARLSISPRRVYDMAPTLPFTVRLGRKCLRFSELGLQKWLDNQANGR